MIYNCKWVPYLIALFYDGTRSKAFDFAPVTSFVCVTKFRQRNMKHIILHALAGVFVRVFWISENSRSWRIQIHLSGTLERASKLNKMQRGLWGLATRAGFHSPDFYKHPFTHLIKFSVLIWVSIAKLLLRNSSDHGIIVNGLQITQFFF